MTEKQIMALPKWTKVRVKGEPPFNKQGVLVFQTEEEKDFSNEKLYGVQGFMGNLIVRCFDHPAKKYELIENEKIQV
jgi:hypothetical protein